MCVCLHHTARTVLAGRACGTHRVLSTVAVRTEYSVLVESRGGGALPRYYYTGYSNHGVPLRSEEGGGWNGAPTLQSGCASA
jgi:hypothetical protein